MGVGGILLEGTQNDAKTGALLSTNTWTYKPPNFHDIPEVFTIEMLDLENQRSNNCWGGPLSCLTCCLGCNSMEPITKSKTKIKSSKALGEPPLLAAYAVMGALRQAIQAARAKKSIVNLETPLNPEQVSRLCWEKHVSLTEMRKE